MLGKLIPVTDGNAIPLRRKVILVGRRESCDIVLRSSDVSARHAWLELVNGYWYVRNANSKNGVRVNGVCVEAKRLDPNDIVAFSKQKFEIRYSPTALGAVGLIPPDVTNVADVFAVSLLERASSPRQQKSTEKDPAETRSKGDRHKSIITIAEDEW